MRKLKALENEYELIENHKSCFNKEEFLNLVTDYFVSYDYIVGDYSYGKLRLKGFCNNKNKKFNKINDFEKLDDYIKDSCAYGCGYFVLKKEIKK